MNLLIPKRTRAELVANGWICRRNAWPQLWVRQGYENWQAWEAIRLPNGAFFECLGQSDSVKALLLAGLLAFRGEIDYSTLPEILQAAPGEPEESPLPEETP
jgi:hypothetical protein